LQIKPNNKMKKSSSTSSPLAQLPARSDHSATRLAGVIARLMALIIRLVPSATRLAHLAAQLTVPAKRLISLTAWLAQSAIRLAASTVWPDAPAKRINHPAARFSAKNTPKLPKTAPFSTLAASATWTAAMCRGFPRTRHVVSSQSADVSAHSKTLRTHKLSTLK
jgi:hypothetical protein